MAVDSQYTDSESVCNQNIGGTWRGIGMLAAEIVKAQLSQKEGGKKC